MIPPPLWIIMPRLSMQSTKKCLLFRRGCHHSLDSTRKMTILHPAWNRRPCCRTSINRCLKPSISPVKNTFLSSNIHLFIEKYSQILAKLRFVAELVDTLMQVAESHDNPIMAAMTNRKVSFLPFPDHKNE